MLSLTRVKQFLVRGIISYWSNSMNTALISALKIYDIVAKLQTIGNCY